MKELPVLRPGAADPLQVVRGPSAAPSTATCRQVADVDAHLQGRRGRQQVHGVGLPCSLKAFSTASALFPRQKPRVLLGKDALDVTLLVETAVIGAVAASRRAESVPGSGSSGRAARAIAPCIGGDRLLLVTVGRSGPGRRRR